MSDFYLKCILSNALKPNAQEFDCRALDFRTKCLLAMSVRAQADGLDCREPYFNCKSLLATVYESQDSMILLSRSIFYV